VAIAMFLCTWLQELWKEIRFYYYDQFFILKLPGAWH